MSEFVVQVLVALIGGSVAGIGTVILGFVKLEQRFRSHLELDTEKVRSLQEKVSHAAELLANSMDHLKDSMNDLKAEIKSMRERLHRVEGSVIRGESELMKFLEQAEKRDK